MPDGFWYAAALLARVECLKTHWTARHGLSCVKQYWQALEPIREVWIHDEAFAASRLSMMRIIARRTNAATVVV